jgi:hypothetical protein
VIRHLIQLVRTWWHYRHVPPFTIVVNVEADAEDYDVVELRRAIIEHQRRVHHG